MKKYRVFFITIYLILISNSTIIGYSFGYRSEYILFRDNYYYILYKGNEYGPFINIWECDIVNENISFYAQLPDKKIVIHQDDTTIGPFEFINPLGSYMGNDNKYHRLYTVELDGEYYVYYENAVIGPVLNHPQFYGAGPNNGFFFVASTDKGTFVYVNNKIYGP